MRNSWPHSRRRGAGVLPLFGGAPPTLCGDGGSRLGYDLPRPQRPTLRSLAGNRRARRVFACRVLVKPPRPTAIPPGSASLSRLGSKTCPKLFATSLESANPAVCALSPTKRRRHRPRGRTRVNRTSHPGRTGPRGAEPRGKLPSLDSYVTKRPNRLLPNAVP
jgi:hypothetical protein